MENVVNDLSIDQAELD